MKTEKIIVANLKSVGCVNKITWKILKMPGVSNVLVDQEHSMVMIEHRENLERPEYLNVLSTLGYPEAKGQSESGERERNLTNVRVSMPA